MSPILAVLALCLAVPACRAAAGDPPAAKADAPGVSSTTHLKTGYRHHWRHWRHYKSAGAQDEGAPVTAAGRGRFLRWHTVRDSHGNRHKQWYYSDTGENVTSPESDNSAAMRDLDAPMSRRDRAELHTQRSKALDHLALVEQRLERDRLARAKKAKANFHRVQKELAVKSAAHKP